MLANVSMFNISFAEFHNHRNIRTAIYAANYLPRELEKQQAEVDNLHPVFGLPPGTVEIIQPMFTGRLEKKIPLLKAQDSNPYLNPAVIQTIMWLTPENVMNGIVAIPREVCLADPRMRVWRPNPAMFESEDHPPERAIMHWYVLPPRHILALHLYKFEQWDPEKQNNPHPLMFRVNDKIVAIGICDQELESLKLQLFTQWRPIIDRRRLGDFSVGASTLTKDTPADLDVKVYITYLTWPNEIPVETIMNLAPEFPEELEKLIK